MAPLTIAAILFPPPGSPWLLQAAAMLALALHVGGGLVGILSGFVALFARKGGPTHRLAGQVFVLSMLTMSGVAAAVAPLFAPPQWSNLIAGAFTFYLVSTGWAAGRSATGRLGPLATAAIAAPLGVAGLCVLGVLTGQAGAAVGDPPPAPYVVGGLASLAAATELSVIWRGGLEDGQRLARHLWRMSAGLLIATGSALAQPRIVPAALQGSPPLFLPIFAILGVMLYWLARLAVSRAGGDSRRRSLTGAQAPRLAIAGPRRRPYNGAPREGVGA